MNHKDGGRDHHKGKSFAISRVLELVPLYLLYADKSSFPLFHRTKSCTQNLLHERSMRENQMKSTNH